MMELSLETFDRTFAFLTSIPCINELTGSPVADDEPIRVLQSLLTALRDDGYALINDVSSSSIDSRLLSGRQSISGHTANATAIILVIICIICAGLASGLTQVQ
jgi:hypothetical protein